MDKQILSDETLVYILKGATRAAGSQAKWAAANNIAPWLVGEVLNGKKRMRPQIASALGFEINHYVRVGMWEEVKKK